MMANRKEKKLCIDDIRGFLEGENESESDFCLSESASELDRSSSAYESSDDLADSVTLDSSLQNISSHTPKNHFQWTKWDDNLADEDNIIFWCCRYLCTTSFKCFSYATL
jgi:hypothetical protein